MNSKALLKIAGIIIVMLLGVIGTMGWWHYTTSVSCLSKDVQEMKMSITAIKQALVAKGIPLVAADKTKAAKEVAVVHRASDTKVPNSLFQVGVGKSTAKQDDTMQKAIK